MNKRLITILIGVIGIANLGFTQTSLPEDSLDILLEEPTVGESIGGASQSSPINLDTPSADPTNLLNNDTKTDEKSRSIKEIMEGDLIQVDLHRNKEEKVDKYPLASYKGKLLKSLDAIKKEYQLKNIETVKASLETMKQGPIPMPAEGDLLLGNVYSQLKLYTKAIESFDIGAKKTQDKEKKLVFELNKAQTLRHWNKNKEAMSILLKMDTDKYGKTYPQIFFYSGLSSLYLNDTKKSVFYLRKYLELHPKSPQAENVKRAIAWLLFSGRFGGGGSGGTGGSGSGGSDYDENQAAQLLKDLENQENSLLKSLSASVDDKDLDIQNKGIEEGEEYSSIAD